MKNLLEDLQWEESKDDKLHYGRAIMNVLQDWLENISWMKQTVLISAFRNCDTMGSTGPHKTLVRGVRMSIIRSSYRPEKLSSGFIMPTPEEIILAGHEFVDNEWDCFPLRFVTHLMHAAQVLGDHYPDTKHRLAWSQTYAAMVHGLHLRPESHHNFQKRLQGDISYIEEQKIGPEDLS